MNQSKQDMIREEQRILDKLINELDLIMLKIDKKYTYSSLQAKKAKEQCLPDTYGALVSANHDKSVAFREKKRLKRVRDELYDTRIVVDCTDDHSTEEEEIKIGLHTYAKFGKPNIAITKYRIAIFCDGEFFHGRDLDKLQLKLKNSNNSEYWI